MKLQSWRETLPIWCSVTSASTLSSFFLAPNLYYCTNIETERQNCDDYNRLSTPNKGRKSYSFNASLSCFEGFTVARTLSGSLRKASRVSFCDATRWSPTKCNENEGNVLPKEKVDILQSSSLLNIPGSTGEVNKGFYVSVLDLYSDDSSHDTSHVGKETAPTKESPISVSAVETGNLLLSETNSQPVINSGNEWFCLK